MTRIQWPLPDDDADPDFVPAIRGRYLQILGLLAVADPAVHDRGALDLLAAHCRWWGLPSPDDQGAAAWARGQLAGLEPAARTPAPPAVPRDGRAGFPGSA